MAEYYTMWVHQIKTPIAAMRLLLQSEDTPKSRECAEELFHIVSVFGNTIFSISLRISKDLVSLVKSGFFKKFRIRNLFRSLRILWGGGNMVALPPLNP